MAAEANAEADPKADAEERRLEEDRTRARDWKRFGPYLSERQWGTVREDYSADGDAWRYLPARSGAQPGLPLGRGWPARTLRPPGPPLLRAGALERRRSDPQGAPVRPDRPRRATTARTSRSSTSTSTPRRRTRTARRSTSTRSGHFPTCASVEENRQRGRTEREFELADTGVFDDGRYFDVTLEYAKAAPDDISDPGDHRREPRTRRRAADAAADALVRQHAGRGGARGRGTCGRTTNRRWWRPARPRSTWRTPSLGKFRFSVEAVGGAVPELLFTENETNTERLYGEPNAGPYVQGRVSRLRRRQARRRRESGAAGDQGGGASTASTCRRGASCACGCGWRR